MYSHMPFESHRKIKIEREHEMTIKKETYPVLGMTCAVCVRKIETVLGKTEGILEASVNFASENVTISYDDQKINLDKISGIIKDIGYELLT